MRLETGLYAGRESLLTHGTALNTIGDNIANSNTPGFKSGRVEFADLMAGGGNSLYGSTMDTGSGVKAAAVSVNHLQQGTMEVTSRSLDAGITGTGWFVLQKNGTEQVYSRAGNFTTDADGFIVTNSGEKVLGYTAESPNTPVPLNARNLVGEAVASSEVSILGKLDSSRAPIQGQPQAATFDQLNEDAAFVNSVSVIDSLGQDRGISLYFYKTGNLTWDVRAYVDAADTGGEPGTPVLVGQGQIAVDENGKQIEGNQTNLDIVAPWAGGAAPGNVTFDLSGITAAAGPSSFSGISVDGVRGGTFTSVGFSASGELTATLDTGEDVIVGQLALANFNSSDGLERIGNNFFRETSYSGEASIDRAGTEGLGSITGGALESSTVDPAEAFVKMIQIQQGYRAGSQVIQTVSELLTATIQIA